MWQNKMIPLSNLLRCVIFRRGFSGYTQCVCHLIIYPKNNKSVSATQTIMRIHSVFCLNAAYVYKYKIRTINQLKTTIRQEIAAIKQGLIRREMQYFINRLHMSMPPSEKYIRNSLETNNTLYTCKLLIKLCLFTLPFFKTCNI